MANLQNQKSSQIYWKGHFKPTPNIRDQFCHFVPNVLSSFFPPTPRRSSIPSKDLLRSFFFLFLNFIAKTRSNHQHNFGFLRKDGISSSGEGLYQSHVARHFWDESPHSWFSHGLLFSFHFKDKILFFSLFVCCVLCVCL